MLIDGQWHDIAHATRNGRFERTESVFRHWVTPDGRPGPTGLGGFAAEPDRYHLYVSLACPWAHRTTITRTLKGLKTVVGLSVVHWLMREKGWTFKPGPGVVGDPVVNARYMSEVYVAADAHYTGRVTVPVLWDKKLRTIVSNESSDIMRMFNSAFDRIGAHACDLRPPSLQQEIDAISARVQHSLNNGVYKVGFATNQDAYEEALHPLFETLDWLEHKLDAQRFLVGGSLTEADVRLFATLVRFDAVYYGHFKCNLRRLQDYPNLSAYARDIYQIEGIADTVDFDHIRRHYYESHPALNPSGIVPVAAGFDFNAPHGRAHRFARRPGGVAEPLPATAG